MWCFCFSCAASVFFFLIRFSFVCLFLSFSFSLFVFVLSLKSKDPLACNTMGPSLHTRACPSKAPRTTASTVFASNVSSRECRHRPPMPGTTDLSASTASLPPPSCRANVFSRRTVAERVRKVALQPHRQRVAPAACASLSSSCRISKTPLRTWLAFARVRFAHGNVYLRSRRPHCTATSKNASIHVHSFISRSAQLRSASLRGSASRRCHCSVPWAWVSMHQQAHGTRVSPLVTTKLPLPRHKRNTPLRADQALVTSWWCLQSTQCTLLHHLQ